MSQWAPKPKRELKDFLVVVAVAAASAPAAGDLDDERPSGSVSRCVALLCLRWSVETMIDSAAAVVQPGDLAPNTGWGMGSGYWFLGSVGR